MPENTSRTQPDLSLTPNYLKARDVAGKYRQKVVSWAGLVDKVEKSKDQQGRTILILSHRFVSLDRAELQKKSKDLKFEMSEKGAGQFQCRTFFKNSVSEEDWEPYFKKEQVLTCTGTIIGYAQNGDPIVEARLLESIPITSSSDFKPVLDPSGRVQMDNEGRQRFTSQ